MSKPTQKQIKNFLSTLVKKDDSGKTYIDLNFQDMDLSVIADEIHFSINDKYLKEVTTFNVVILDKIVIGPNRDKVPAWTHFSAIQYSDFLDLTDPSDYIIHQIKNLEEIDHHDITFLNKASNMIKHYIDDLTHKGLNQIPPVFYIYLKK